MLKSPSEVLQYSLSRRGAEFRLMSKWPITRGPLTLPEYEETVIYCPYCGTDDVERGRWVAFHSAPDKKSA